MMQKDKREVWQRGPVEGIAALLQPVAHALLQAREEVNELMENFPNDLLWDSPAKVATPGFHLQHLTGVLDRLFTYARQESLSESQLQSLSVEGKLYDRIIVNDLVKNFNKQVDFSLKQLSQTDEQTLLEPRGVGRAQISSNLIGLYVHAAEHTMRHVGQLRVTVKVLLNK
jgi:hypothetical protein